ncbi:hypothetical protein OROMI_016198 [Orobanche minor]
MSSARFKRGKGKAITGADNPRRGRGGASGSAPNPSHTPSSNSIPSPNFGDYVPDDLTDEQINEMFEVSKSITGDDEQKQPKNPKQRKPTRLKSPLFAIHYTKTDDYISSEKGGDYETLNGHMQRQHPDKVGIESTQTQLRGTAATSSNAPNQVFLVAKLLDPQVREEGLLKLLTLYYTALFPTPIANFTPPNPSDLVQIAKNSLSALYRKYACSYSGSLDLGTGSSSPVHIPSSSSISFYGFAIPDLGEWNAYQEDLSRKLTRYQSNAYQELENYLTTFDLGALERGPDGNNNLLKWWAKRSTIFPVVATIAKEILAVPASTVFVEQAFSVGGYILDERRSRLTPQNLEAQALLNDWVKAELRQQELNYNEQEDSDSYDTGSSNDSINLDD